MALCSVDEYGLIVVPHSGHPGHCNVDEHALVVVPSSARPATKRKKTCTFPVSKLLNKTKNMCDRQKRMTFHCDPFLMALCSVDEYGLIVVPQGGHPGHGSVDEHALVVVPSSAHPGYKKKSCTFPVSKPLDITQKCVVEKAINIAL